MKFGVQKKDGVSNVVASIMILGIMTSLMGMVFTTYVPAMAESVQYEHQTKVTEDFIVFKNQVDVLIVRNDLEVSLSSTMTLGDKGGPVMSVGQNSGSLAFYPAESPSSIYNATPPNENFARGTGTVTFETQYDRIANKNFYFQHDAIIIEQEGKAVMKVAPNIFLKKSNGEISFSYTTISFGGEALSVSGTKTVSTTTTLVSTQKNVYYHGGNNGIDDVELNFTTQFENIWVMYFTDLADDADLAAGDFEVKSGTGWCALRVNDVDKLTTNSAVIEVSMSD